jgi:hypothetical protein
LLSLQKSARIGKSRLQSGKAFGTRNTTAASPVRRLGSPAAARNLLLREQLLQTFEDREHGPFLKLPEGLRETLHINRPELIERHKTRATLKSAARSPRVRASAGGHGRDNHSPEVFVQFVRRYDHAGARLLDFAAERGIESNEKDLAPTDRLAS